MRKGYFAPSFPYMARDCRPQYLVSATLGLISLLFLLCSSRFNLFSIIIKLLGSYIRYDRRYPHPTSPTAPIGPSRSVPLLLLEPWIIGIAFPGLDTPFNTYASSLVSSPAKEPKPFRIFECEFSLLSSISLV